MPFCTECKHYKQDLSDPDMTDSWSCEGDSKLTKEDSFLLECAREDRQAPVDEGYYMMGDCDVFEPK